MTYKLLLKYGIILILFPSVYNGLYPQKIVIIQFICFGLYTFLYYKNRKYWTISDFNYPQIFYLYLIYNIITYIRGFFNVDSITDVHNLFGSLLISSSLLPFLFFLGQPLSIKYIWKSILSLGIVIFIINYFYPSSSGVMNLQHNLSCFNYFALSIPFIKRKYQIFILLVGIFCVLQNLDSRSILLNYVVVLLILFFWKFIKKNFIRRMIISILFSAPIVLLILGLLGIFNVFKTSEQVDFKITEDTRNITIDSRTSIYEDVFGELDRKNAYIFGLGGNGKTRTSLTDNLLVDYSKIYKYGRPGTESGMLNHIQYGGLFGFIAYMLIFLFAVKSSFNAKNDFVQMLCLFIAFKFLFSFIEDRVYLSANTFYIFISIGICYNKTFIRMTNNDVKSYFSLIFK